MKFSAMFHISSTIKNNSSKIKNKTQNTRYSSNKVRYQISEENLLISYISFYFKKRNHNCIAWEN